MIKKILIANQSSNVGFRRKNKASTLYRYFRDMKRCIDEMKRVLKDKGYWLVGLDLKGEESLDQVDPAFPLAVVVGGEKRGIRRLVREQCDHLVRLPMKGQLASLNLSVAAGVLLYLIILKKEGSGQTR